VRLPEGWTQHRDALLCFFGPEGRRKNLACDVVSNVLIHGENRVDPPEKEKGPLGVLVAAIRRGAESALHARLTPAAVDLSYYHLIYTGRVDSGNPGRKKIDDRFRELIYPRGPDAVSSQSPHIDEWAFLGYAFSILADAEQSPGRLSGVVKMIQIVGFQYSRLSSICEEFQTWLMRGGNVRWSSLPGLEERMHISYSHLMTPTFSFNHQILQLRDALMQEWGLDRLLLRTERLLESVRARRQQRRDRMTNILSWVLGFIAALAIVDALDSALSLYREMF
jgi:hypothetical protein